MMIGEYALPGTVMPGSSPEHSTMILPIVAMLTLATIDQPAQYDCEMPPRGSSQAVIDCYDSACTDLQANIANCNGDKPCIAAAMAVYQLDLLLCRETACTSDDLVFWFDGERWIIAWPGEEYSTASMQLSFNI